MATWTRPRSLAIGAIAAAAVLVSVFALYRAATVELAASSQAAAQAAAAPVRHVGGQACIGCHAKEGEEWRGSHHELSMQPANESSVLAPFRGERFTEDGVTTVFSRKDGRFYIRTDGPDGRIADFEVTHALGITPLQQYLVSMPDGRLQAFGIAWDARPREAGGQRWFHLHAGEHVRAGDPLHWTGRQNNWNAMCADCHTTAFRKNFDPVSRTYRSTWSEMHVSCEACHGPGSRHVDWANRPAPLRQDDAGKGLLQDVDHRRQAAWTIDGATGNAVRSEPPPARRKEIELCARCHSHRSQFGESAPAGQPLMDSHAPSVITPDLFWGDGQMKGEVFNHASFQQSRMYVKGVNCGDCHNPHSLKLRAPGNQACFQCHAPAKYESAGHHFHKTGSSGASCAGCHMPPAVFMSIDARHDHGIRVPRPDLSVQYGVPNACTRCHANKTDTWAASRAKRWYPRLGERRNRLAGALLSAGANGRDSLASMLEVIRSTGEESPMARASMLGRLPLPLSLGVIETVRARLADQDPLVRKAAIEALAPVALAQRAPWLRPLLADPVRAVRIEAARSLAGASIHAWSAGEREQFNRALEEYIAAQQYNADRPEAWNNLGMLHADLQEWTKAEAALERALAIAPDFSATALNLADVYRLQGKEREADKLIGELIRKEPRNAAAHYALGLSHLRRKNVAEALPELECAAQLAPGDMQFAYAYALALDSAGRPREVLGTPQPTPPTRGREHPAPARRCACAIRARNPRAS